MGENFLKVKDKKYVGDGKLVLSESEEIKTPIKDDDVPFAKGGIADVRVGFVKGKAATKAKQLIEYIKKQFSPMDAMKEVNKVIGKQGKYKNLTQKDIDEIVEKTEDFIFQRDPDNLYVEDRPMFKKETDDVDLSQGMIDLDEMNFTKNAQAAKKAIDSTSDADLLMKKYPGMGKELAEQIATDTNPKRKANVIAMVEQTIEMGNKGMSGDDIIQTFKNTPRTKQATGGITQLRNGYYGGGQAMVGEDLSQIGHGSDSLMARNMQLAPNSMATTSTGLNYLLGEDNDTVRVPYNEGNMVLPKPKPAQSPLVELSRIYKTYEEAMPGVSKDTQQFLQNDFIQKLQNAKISQEEFMTYKMQNNFADGGRIGYDQGGSSQPMGPEFSTNDPKAALKEIIKRFIPVKDYGIPLIGNSQLMFNGLDNVQAGGQSDLFGGELNYGLKKSLTDDKFGVGFEFTKSFAEGGPARQNFKMGRRAFLGLMGSVGAGIAGLKSGIVNFTKGGGKKVATEVAKEAATGGPPPYFFKLVDKIRKLGDNVTETGAIAERQSVKQYKNFTLTEDTTTGRIEIQKVKTDAGEEFGYDNFGNGLTEEVYMGYSPNETIIVKGKPVEIGPQYDEGTAYLRNDGPNTGDVYEEVSGVTDDIFEEVGEEIPEIIRKEKADGGRIGFYEGGDYNRSKMKELADAFARQKYGRTLTDLPDVKRFEMEDLAIKSLSKDIEKKADGGRIGYAGGKKVVEEVIKKVNKKFGKKAVTTADKAEIPKETLLRDMFTDTNKRLNKSTTPESEKIVGDILEDTNINDLFDVDGKLNKDAVLNAATKTPVQQEGKFTKAEYLIERIKNTIKGSPDDKYVQKTFPGFIDELKANPDLAKNENVFKELGGDLPEGQQIVVYGDDSIDFFTQKSGPGNIDRLKKLMAKHNISREKALKIMKMEPNDQVMELKMLEVANRKLHATGGLASILG
jgi:hypothetical protein